MLEAPTHTRPSPWREATVRLRPRGLIFTLALGLLMGPFSADAQQTGRVWRIGYLTSGGNVPEPFRQGLRELGYVEDQNIAEGRFAELKLDRLPDLAAELVRLKVDIIVTQTTPAAQAAKRATSTIPIVIATAGDAVGSGLVASLPRPGGNITGLSFLGTELAAKNLELLKEASPKVSRVAVLWNPDIAPEALALKAMEVAAQSLGVTLQPVAVRSRDDFASAFATIRLTHADALTAFEST